MQERRVRQARPLPAGRRPRRQMLLPDRISRGKPIRAVYVFDDCWVIYNNRIEIELKSNCNRIVIERFYVCAGDTKKLPADCRADGCGKGANCERREDGGYVCRCPPGTVGSPQTECALGKCVFFFLLIFFIIKNICHDGPVPGFRTVVPDDGNPVDFACPGHVEYVRRSFCSVYIEIIVKTRPPPSLLAQDDHIRRLNKRDKTKTEK